MKRKKPTKPESDPKALGTHWQLDQGDHVDYKDLLNFFENPDGDEYNPVCLFPGDPSGRFSFVDCLPRVGVCRTLIFCELRRSLEDIRALLSGLEERRTISFDWPSCRDFGILPKRRGELFPNLETAPPTWVPDQAKPPLDRFWGHYCRIQIEAGKKSLYLLTFGDRRSGCLAVFPTIPSRADNQDYHCSDRRGFRQRSWHNEKRYQSAIHLVAGGVFTPRKKHASGSRTGRDGNSSMTATKPILQEFVRWLEIAYGDPERGGASEFAAEPPPATLAFAEMALNAALSGDRPVLLGTSLPIKCVIAGLVRRRAGVELDAVFRGDLTDGQFDALAKVLRAVKTSCLFIDLPVEPPDARAFADRTSP